MKYSDWRYEIDLVEGPLAFFGIKKAVETGVKAGAGAVGTVAKALSKGIGKTAAGKPQYKKSDRLQAARDRDGDGKLERKQKDGEFQETLLYDIIHDYIITENEVLSNVN